jgi:hypothetical protein
LGPLLFLKFGDKRLDVEINCEIKKNIRGIPLRTILAVGCFLRVKSRAELGGHLIDQSINSILFVQG